MLLQGKLAKACIKTAGNLFLQSQIAATKACNEFQYMY